MRWESARDIVFYMLSVVVVFPIPIIFSLFLNEIRIKWVRSTVQSLSLLPYFISAAEADGANRWDEMFHITLPCISISIIVMLIISVGNIFTVNLDRILLMYNPSVYDTADVIQTYVYRIAFESKGFPDYSYGTAVNILKSVIAFILVTIVNKLTDKFAETRLF